MTKRILLWTTLRDWPSRRWFSCCSGCVKRFLVLVMYHLENGSWRTKVSHRMWHLIPIIPIIYLIFLFSEKGNLIHSSSETCDETVASGCETDPPETAENRMIVRYFFHGRDSTEMDVKSGEVVTIVCNDNEDFWLVRRGLVEGLVPAICFDDD